MKEVRKLHTTEDNELLKQTADQYVRNIENWWHTGDITKIVCETNTGNTITLTKEMVPNLAKDVQLGQEFRMKDGAVRYLRVGEPGNCNKYLRYPLWQDMTVTAIFLDTGAKGIITRVRDNAEIEILD